MRALTLICLAFMGAACAERSALDDQSVVVLPPVEVVHMDQVAG